MLYRAENIYVFVEACSFKI